MKNQKKSYTGAIITTLVTAVIWMVLVMPPLNIKSGEFWMTLLVLAVVFAVTAGLGQLNLKNPNVYVQHGPTVITTKQFTRYTAIAAAGAALLIGLIGFNTPLFRANSYCHLLTVEEGTEADIPSSASTETIALMDTASAAKLGDRKLGTLTSVVSQFELGGYMQLNYKNKPIKASPLEYAGFIKWFKNKGSGIPGYVTVDPVNMDAAYTPVQQGMKYVPSAYFLENLHRHIYLRYPTAMLYDIHFEIDEEGNPWYVAPVYTHKIGLFGGTQIVSVILVNPIDGSMEKYDVADAPVWVDVVFSGDLLCQHYNYYAQYQQGFWNSRIGQTGCKRTTTIGYKDEDGGTVMQSEFGYLAKDGDIWIYTGVTSVNGDSSNLGFIIANERTAETKYISCAGADELSAMLAAEGEVQEKRYRASFPSLITVDDQPTYIMVLKDSSGLVKMYAAVNVEQYNLVATSADLKDCLQKYTRLVGGEPVVEETEEDLSSYREKTITVSKMVSVVKDGNTYLYIADEDSNIYYAEYAKVITMMLVEEGDTITISTDGTQFRYE